VLRWRWQNFLGSWRVAFVLEPLRTRVWLWARGNGRARKKREILNSATGLFVVASSFIATDEMHCITQYTIFSCRKVWWPVLWEQTSRGDLFSYEKYGDVPGHFVQPQIISAERDALHCRQNKRAPRESRGTQFPGRVFEIFWAGWIVNIADFTAART